MLIIGGLISIAIVALLGAVLLSRGGKDEKKIDALDASGQASQVEPQQPEITRPLEEMDDLRPAQTSVTETRNSSTLSEAPRMVVSYSEARDIHVAHSQLYELTEQLQILNRQSLEIEQRLHRINEALAHFEKDERATTAIPSKPQSFQESRGF